MSAGYGISTEGAEALAAGVAETLLKLLNPANAVSTLVAFGVSFDGVTATAVPVLVELMSSTEAAAGTSSAATVVQKRGPVRTAQCTGRHSFSVEPTVLTSLAEPYLVRADGGLFVIQYPLGREPQQIVTADAQILRVTAPAIVNARAWMEWEEGG